MYKERVKNSALNRVKPQQSQRNLAIALYNVLNDLDVKKRKEWIKSLLPLVSKKKYNDENTVSGTEWKRCYDFMIHSHHSQAIAD